MNLQGTLNPKPYIGNPIGNAIGKVAEDPKLSVVGEIFASGFVFLTVNMFRLHQLAYDPPGFAHLIGPPGLSASCLVAQTRAIHWKADCT